MKATILPKLGMCTSAHEAVSQLERMGARCVGEGHFSKVYRVEVASMPEPLNFYDISALSYREYMSNPLCPAAIKREVRIIKVATRPDAGALIVAKAAMACAEIDPLAPVYYGITEFGNGTFMAEMEELSPVQGLDAFKGITCREKVVSRFELPRMPLDEAITSSPFLSVLAAYMKRGGYNWDIHADNVMMRGAQPVVTDPMYRVRDC